ncbi:MAG: hypothetical protein ACYSUY_15805 [Planctomycetota bacterium]|jgi:hypothetical protein
MVSVDDIIQRWKRSDLAWRDDPPLFLNPKKTNHVFQVFESPNIHKSGRAMWNMGMWLDTHWHEFDQHTKQRLLKAVESTMLSADHDRAMGLWKLGESLGFDIATKATRHILEKVAKYAIHKETINSALHGLAHYAHDHTRSRESICLYLSRLARRRNRLQYKKTIKSTINSIRRGCPCA